MFQGLPLIRGKHYLRRDLHAEYGGQTQHGISTPSRHPLVFLFAGETGEQYGYRDGWESPDLYLYTGEGQLGDMEFTRGNAAIRDHLRDRKDLHLFRDLGGGEVRYVGQMLCVGNRVRSAHDRVGKMRRAIVFELVPLDTVTAPETEEEISQLNLPIEELRRRAMQEATEEVPAVQRQVNVRKRSAYIKAYVLRRAAGICESCGEPAPFRKSGGEPFLEAHHIQRLSDGGPDDPEWVGGICPNCHREAHHGEEAEVVNERLRSNVLAKERR